MCETKAIENANSTEESWRLLICTLFVTIKPCVMCVGRLGQPVFLNVSMNKNQKLALLEVCNDILTDERLNCREVETGILKMRQNTWVIF